MPVEVLAVQSRRAMILLVSDRAAVALAVGPSLMALSAEQPRRAPRSAVSWSAQVFLAKGPEAEEATMSTSSLMPFRVPNGSAPAH